MSLFKKKKRPDQVESKEQEKEVEKKVVHMEKDMDFLEAQIRLFRKQVR